MYRVHSSRVRQKLTGRFNKEKKLLQSLTFAVVAMTFRPY
jgi:hypothetical protein